MDQTSQVFGEAIQKVMDTLMEAASGMYHAAGEMTAASAAMHEESASTSEGARLSSDNLNRVASSVQALTADFKDTAREVAVASSASRQAVLQVEASQETIRGLDEFDRQNR